MKTEEMIVQSLKEKGRAVVQVESDIEVMQLYQMIYRIERQHQLMIGRFRVNATTGHFVFLWLEGDMPPKPGQKG